MHPSQNYLILSKYFSETIYPYLIKCWYWHQGLLHFNFKRRDTSQERATSFLITANLHPAPWCCSSGLSGSFTGTRRTPRLEWPQRLSASRSPHPSSRPASPRARSPSQKSSRSSRWQCRSQPSSWSRGHQQNSPRWFRRWGGGRCGSYKIFSAPCFPCLLVEKYSAHTNENRQEAKRAAFTIALMAIIFVLL